MAAADFDLAGAADLIRDERVKDGASFERAINAKGKNRVDVDGDGKRDRLQVVERRDANARELEIRALPSGRRDTEPDTVAVPIASVSIIPVGEIARVSARYADVVVIEEPPVIAFNAPIITGTFCHWVLVIERPIFVGATYVVVHHYKHRKHKKHRKHRKHRKHKKHRKHR